MFDVPAYLRSELRRYFPDAKIDVHEGDERWDIGIRFQNAPVILDLHMNVGSDDDCFRFYSNGGSCYTVPFAPEMSA